MGTWRALGALLHEDSAQHVELACHAIANYVAAERHHVCATAAAVDPKVSTEQAASVLVDSAACAAPDSGLGSLRPSMASRHHGSTGVARRLRTLVPSASKSMQALPAMQAARALCAVLLPDADAVIGVM